MFDIIIKLISEIWEILLDSSLYILVGILIAGLLRVILNPNTIVKHLGYGRYSSVVKAALLGVPLPL